MIRNRRPCLVAPRILAGVAVTVEDQSVIGLGGPLGWCITASTYTAAAPVWHRCRKVFMMKVSLAARERGGMPAAWHGQ